MGVAILWLVNQILNLMVIFIIAAAVMSWLVAFNVLNPRNRLVYAIGSFLEAVTQPLLAPFRRIIPPLGGIDISPIVVLLLLRFVQIIFNNMAGPVLVGL
ncbi:YggT family protein [Brevundimonas sp.]|uniref:YggT family protein n=1 Tax=Brevundimonas sp. TaxID=1871086 RepID=UPI0025D344F3|nr:YggT family protein [Brevundimonas sp.]